MEWLSSGFGVGGATYVVFSRDEYCITSGETGETASPLGESSGAANGSRQLEEDALCLAHRRKPPIAPIPSMYEAVQTGILHLNTSRIWWYFWAWLSQSDTQTGASSPGTWFPVAEIRASS